MKSTMPCTSACDSRDSTEPSRHFRSASRFVPDSLDLLRERDHALRRVRPPVEDDVLDVLEQILRDVLVDDQLSGVDDAHVHAGLDGVEQERGVNRLAHHVVAAEREREVADPAADLHARARAA